MLVLPVATLGLRGFFSIMNIIKNKLRSKMGQKYLNDCWLYLLEGNSSCKLRMRTSSIIFKALRTGKLPFNL